MSDKSYIQSQVQGSVTVLELGPECKLIDEVKLEEIGAALMFAVRSVKTPHVVIDLSATTFFGSGFIEVLSRAWKELQRQPHAVMGFCGVQKYCREVLEVMHLDRIWPIYATRDEAVAAMSSPQA